MGGGGWGGGGGVAPNICYAEANSPSATDDPSGVPMDTFYDAAQNPQSAASVLAPIGLSYDAGAHHFTALETGCWLLNFSWQAGTPDPTNAWQVSLSLPTYAQPVTNFGGDGSNHTNPDRPQRDDMTCLVYAREGDTFYPATNDGVGDHSTGPVITYGALSITRLQ